MVHNFTLRKVPTETTYYPNYISSLATLWIWCLK